MQPENADELIEVTEEGIVIDVNELQ